MWTLYRDAKRHSDADLQTLEYGLILFSLFWIVWIWYQKTWVFPTVNIFYWVMVAYCLDRIRVHKQEAAARRRPLGGRGAWPPPNSRRS
jgi:hypothetical protein